MPEEEVQEKKPGRRRRAGEEDQEPNVSPPQRKVLEGGWGFGDGGNSAADAKGSGSSMGEAPSKKSSGEKGESGGTNVAKPGRRRGVNSFAVEDIGETAEQKRRNQHFKDDDNDILIIPDLEEDLEEDLTTQVASAPKNTARRVQSMRELDHDIKYTLPTNVQNGLDLSILTSCLSPQPLVQESDELWEFDSLLQFVSQELTADADAEEAEKTGAAEAAAAATK